MTRALSPSERAIWLMDQAAISRAAATCTVDTATLPPPTPTTCRCHGQAGCCSRSTPHSIRVAAPNATADSGRERTRACQPRLEQIRKREENEQRRREQPLIRIPDYPPPRDSSDEERDDQDIPGGERGVVIISL